ncbi:hypothetical protein GCM10011412_34060 [Maribacter cobaltidurans]|nr:hypothetical protein GCM10011412_34060 [Maribacter cobaltidurans]
MLYGSIAGFFFILSVINLYDSNKENEELINTARTILTKTSNLNEGLNQNFDVISETKSRLIVIDSELINVQYNLNNQLNILDSTIGKTSKLYQIQASVFASNRPKLMITDIFFRAIEEDTSLLNIQFKIENVGGRIAKIRQISNVAIGLKKFTNQLIHFKNIHSDGRGYNFEIEPQGSMNYLFKINLSKKYLVENFSNFTSASFVKYEDLSTKEQHLDTFYFDAKYINNGELNFLIPTEPHIEEVKNYIKEYQIWE